MLTALAAMAQQPQDPGLVAHWPFDEGEGTIAHDDSGNGLHGSIVGAAWETGPDGVLLRCDGSGDFVDCGRPDPLMLTGDLTVTAWIKLQAAPYPDYYTNWYLIDCEQYQQDGWMLRVDGNTATLCFRTSQPGRSQYGFSNAVLENGVVYHVAVVRQGEQTTFYVDGVRDATFPTSNPAPPTASFRIGQGGQSMQGTYDDVRVYDRSLSEADILRLVRSEATSRRKDASWLDHVVLRPFFRFDRNTVIVDADFRGVVATGKAREARAELRATSGRVLDSKPIENVETTCRQDVTFSLDGAEPGRYEVRVTCRGPLGDVSEEVAFDYPHPPPSVPDPSMEIVSTVPPPPAAVSFEIAADTRGGFLLAVAGKRFAVESRFSYPHGGENSFLASPASATAEPGWRVESRQLNADAVRVQGEGATYRIERQLRRFQNRIAVRDTIANTSNAAIGLFIANRLQTGDVVPTGAWLAGRACGKHTVRKPVKTNPTAFLQLDGVGVGLVALDDVFIVQAQGEVGPDGCGLCTDEFAIAAGAEYTLEWAIYVNGSGDYYDFVNEVRRDEGRNSVAVESGFAIPYAGGRRTVPTREWLQLRGAKYVISSCLSHIADDPELSIEGIGFMHFPKEKGLIRDQMLGIRRVEPDAKPMFHVAHSLFLTDKPEAAFPDSRVIAADGTQAVWEDPGHGYISKKRQEAGWRWWIFYPTLDNSFGKALLRSVDVMVDEMGCRGVFMDGFMWGYRGEYTYDRWDGHTADIDPETKTLKRKKGSVLLLSQPALVAFVEKMQRKGAVVIANNTVVTRTIGRLPIITDREISEGPDVHLSQTPITMGNMPKIKTPLDVYRDVRRKLTWGNLYMYYGERELDHPSVPQRMYPITVDEIRAGTVRGKERLVTMHSGVYGWPGSDDLHVVYLYDGRGYPAPHSLFCTVDGQGVRTGLELGDDQTAVVKRIPVRLATRTPVNVLVRRYSPNGIELLLHGSGETTVSMEDGELPVRAGARFRWQIDGRTQPVTEAGGRLVVPLHPREQMLLSIAPVPETD